MWYYVVKLLISAALIVAISELGKRYTFLGALLASLPLVSWLAFVWLYHDTGDPMQVAALSKSIFWLVLPSLALFVVLPWLLARHVNFYLALAAATAAMFACYGLMVLVLHRFDVHL